MNAKFTDKIKSFFGCFQKKEQENESIQIGTQEVQVVPMITTNPKWIPLFNMHQQYSDCYLQLETVAKLLGVDKITIEEAAQINLTQKECVFATSDGCWTDAQAYGSGMCFNLIGIIKIAKLLNVSIDDANLQKLEQTYKTARHNSYLD